MSRRTAILCVALVLGCAGSSPYMEDGTPPESPEPGKALVYFLRPGRTAWTTDLQIWHGETFIGHALAHSCFAYSSAPGRQFFMTLGENGSGVDANLESGKTYYVLAQARRDGWRWRISLVPVSRGSELWDQAALWAKDLAFTVTLPGPARAFSDAWGEEARRAIDAFETEEGRAHVKQLPSGAGR